MIKKIFSVSLIVLFAVVVFSVSAKSALATNSPSWHWETEALSSYVYIDVAVDDRCDNANRPFKVVVFDGHDQTGSRARLCGYWDDLSQLPQYKGANAPSFNNSISSFWVKEIGSNYSVEFSFLKDQEGTKFLSDLGKWDLTAGFDNKFSSVRRISNPL